MEVKLLKADKNEQYLKNEVDKAQAENRQQIVQL